MSRPVADLAPPAGKRPSAEPPGCNVEVLATGCRNQRPSILGIKTLIFFFLTNLAS